MYFPFRYCLLTLYVVFVVYLQVQNIFSLALVSRARRTEVFIVYLQVFRLSAAASIWSSATVWSMFICHSAVSAPPSATVWSSKDDAKEGHGGPCAPCPCLVYIGKVGRSLFLSM